MRLLGNADEDDNDDKLSLVSVSSPEVKQVNRRQVGNKSNRKYH